MTSFSSRKQTLTCALAVLSLMFCVEAFAQPTSSDSTSTPVIIEPEATPSSPKKVQADNRIFGVLPNYRTADSTQGFEPITAKRKFTIAFKDSFDWPVYFVSGAFAGLYQLEDSNPGFGQGVKGFARRYGTSYADQVIGNMMTEAIMPTLLREDPRYFRRSEGSKMRRTGYALTRIFVTHTDNGGQRFNFSEVVGNGVTASISNAYYPDNRGFSDTMQRFSTQLATDAFSNVLKEFWPDIKRRFFNKHDHQ